MSESKAFLFIFIYLDTSLQQGAKVRGGALIFISAGKPSLH